MVPNSWQSGRFDDFIVLQRGFDLTHKNRVDGSIPVVSSSGVSYFHNEAKAKGPGIVTGRKGSLGKVFLIEEDFWPHDTSLWVKEFKGNDIYYVKYFLESLKLERFDEASSVPTLNRNNVHRLKVVFPPLEEQRKSAKVLSTWDKAISTTKCLVDNSKKSRKYLKRQLFTGRTRLFDGSGKPFEYEWKKERLSHLCDIKTGKKDVNEGNPKGVYPFFTCANKPTKSDSYTYDCEALLIAGNGMLGKTHYYNGKFEAYQRTYILSSFELKIKVNYLHQYILYWLARDIDREKQHGAMPYIKLGLLQNFNVNLPCLEEQKKIATVLTNADKEIELLEQQLADLKQEKKALMQQLLTGKRRIKV
jgi:type I restriction enzyme S subunit